MNERQQQALTFENLLQIHAYLHNIEHPSESIKAALTNIETTILAYTTTLTTNNPTEH